MTAMPAMKLWQLGDEWELLEEAIAAAEGEITPEIEAQLEAIEGAFADKAERIALLIRERTVTAEAVKAEEDRLHAIRKSHETSADGLKRYLLAQLERVGRDKVDTPKVRIRRVRNSQPSIRWTGGQFDIPEQYRRTTYALDTSAVKEDIEAGADIPEGIEVVRGHHVRIA